MNSVQEIKPKGDRPKFLIGIPGYAGIQPEVQEHIITMIFRAGRDFPDMDFAVAIPTKREQFRARNHLVRMAIDNNCDYLLMLDDDMVVPSDLIKRLMAHDVEVCGALYYQRGGAFHPVIMKRHETELGEFRGEFYSPIDPIIRDPGLHEVDIIGGGCMLFKVEVFNRLTEPYFWWEATSGTDIAICSNLRAAGAKVYIDTSIEIGHLGNKQIITSRSVPEDERVMGRLAENLWLDLKSYYKQDDEWLRDRVEVNGQLNARADAWGKRETDEEIFSYYEEDPDWHVFNLSYWCIHKPDKLKQWVLTQAPIPDKGRVIDYSTGIGHLAIGLAEERNVYVDAYDLKGAGTEGFFSHRITQSRDRRKGGVYQWLVKGDGTHEEMWDDSVTPGYTSLDIRPKDNADGACLISAIEHLTHPYETVEWIVEQIKPGGWFVCDWEHGGWSEDNPQHITRYDMTTFERWMADHDMMVSPEYSWLFFKRG